MRVALYVRVSTDLQTRQIRRSSLGPSPTGLGGEIAETYIDQRISGAKSRKDRPGFDRLLKDGARRRFDLIACWSVDRLGRSLKDLVGFLQEVHALGIGLYLHQQGLDTTTPAGTAMFQMLGVFAEFERGIIRERVLAGLGRARAEGRVLGRPRMAEEKTKAIRAALVAGGGSLRQIAAQHRVGLGTVQRVAKSLSPRTQTI